jgi:hypothetical protein
MRLVQGSDRSVEVTWYWSPPHAKPAPYTRLASGNWASDPVWPWLGVGEVKDSPRTYYNGKNVWGFKGDHHCGTDKQFAEGLTTWPTGWKWCCCPWVSSPRLGLMDPPAGAHEQFIAAPYYAAPAQPIAPTVPHTSAVSIGFLPGRGAAPIRPGSSGGPAAPRTWAIHRSSATLDLSPASRSFLLPPGPGGYGAGSSVTGGPGRIEGAAHVSVACLCVDPDWEQPPPPTSLSGYGSSRGSSHFGSSPATTIFSFTSRACVCFSPRSSATLHLDLGSSVSYGSYATTSVSNVSKVCLCFQPAAGELFNANTSYSGPQTVLTPCCTRPLPRVLYLDVVGAPSQIGPFNPCTCLTSLIVLTYDDSLLGWYGHANMCGQTVRFTLGCIPSPVSRWTLGILWTEPNFVEGQAPLTCPPDPVHAVFTFPDGSMSTLCSGSAVCTLRQ